MNTRLQHYLSGAYRSLLGLEKGAVWIVAIVGLGLSFAALLLIRQQLEVNRLLDFQWAAQNRVRALTYHIDNSLLAVTTISDHILIFGDIGEKEFQLLAGSVLDRHRYIQSLAWVPRVSSDERMHFESSLVPNANGIGISEHDNDAKPVPAGERNEYFPLRYRASDQQTNFPLGFDLGSIPEVAAALARARDHGEIAASGRIAYSMPQGIKSGFLVASPVYNRDAPLETVEQRRAALIGFVVGSYRYDSLTKAAVAMLEPRGVEILILDGSSHTAKDSFLYFYASRLLPEQVGEDNYSIWLEKQDEPKIEKRIQLADRELLVVCGRTNSFKRAESFHQSPWMVLLAGLLFTVLLSFYLLRIRENMQHRAAMEQRLAEREALFRQMTETVDEVFWAATADDIELQYLSPTHEQMLGDPSQQRYRTLLDVIVPEERDVLREEMRRLVRERGNAEVLHHIRRADDVLRWVRIRGFAVRGSDGHVQRLVGFMEDITERKLADEALRDSESKLRNLFQHSPDIIMTVDAEGTILLMNRSIPALPAERALGHNALALSPRELRKWFRKSLKKVFKKGTTSQFEYSAADGTYWAGRMVPIRSGDGPVTAAMLIAGDVTEKRHLETQALQNARLASIGVLAAGVAHEINNPNNAIQFNAALLDRAWKDVLPILKEYYTENGDFAVGGVNYSQAAKNLPLILSETIRNSDRIRRIVKNLKHMSRQDTDELAERVDIQQVVEAAVMILHNQIQKFTDQFFLDIPDGLPLVQGNSQQLEQVIINLLLNALQALANRESSVRVQGGYDADDCQLWIVISDQGKGIPERDLSRLTEPFFTTRAESGGTGLGLSISRAIVERHDGSLGFESEVDVGTKVTIRLPPIKHHKELK